ncbi:MAG TPA: efflux RND transporter periplasmic adaptor subunit [Longimicrobiaceae bacterium]|jgi:HlyD family secretion protein|nr:efflux RND transporter periplasmic adaptor subunit [Longimicrobiaceae bacterium]
MSNGRKAALGGLLVVAFVGLGAAAVKNKSAKGTAVRTELASRRNLVSIVTASGKIEPKRKVDISADISGRVVQVAVEEGQWVNKGQVLVRIDPTAYEAALRRAQASVAQAQAQAAQARANLLKAQSDRRRSEQLAAGRDLISPADLEQARTQQSVAEAQLQAAQYAINQAQAGVSESQEALRKTTIVAPMSGRVTRKNIEEGETAIVGTMNNPGTVLLTVADLSVMEATVKVDETDVPNIQYGDSAVVRIDAFPNQTFSGKVTRIANSSLQTGVTAAGSDQQAVDFEVVITLDHPPADLRPDLSATADIVTAAKSNALSVPIIALTVRDHNGKKFRATTEDDPSKPQDPSAPKEEKAGEKRDEVEGVFVVENGKARFVPVQVGITGANYFEIRGGLRGGETVVSGSYQAIRDLESGNPVKVSNPPAPAAKPGTPAAAPKEKR